MGLGQGTRNRCERRLGGSNDLRTYRNHRARSGYCVAPTLWLEIAAMTMAEAVFGSAAVLSCAVVLTAALFAFVRR